MLLGHPSGAEEGTVDLHEGASARRGVSEALGIDSMTQESSWREEEQIAALGRTNLGELEGGRRSGEVAKANKTDITPQNTRCSDHRAIKPLSRVL